MKIYMAIIWNGQHKHDTAFVHAETKKSYAIIQNSTTEYNLSC